MDLKTNYIDRLGFIDIKSKKILLTLSKNKDTWYIPGGKREKGETNEMALVREIKEELSVDITPNSLSYFSTIEGNAHGKPKGTKIRIAYYTGSYTGTINPQSEIEKFDYFSFKNLPQLTETGRIIISDLKSKHLID